MNNLTTYKKSPRNEHNINTLEALCLDRLKLYQIINSARLHNLVIGTEKWAEFLKSQIRKANLNIYINLLDCCDPSTIEEAREKDNIAHWILGLKYSETEELQNEYAHFELQWFQLVYMNTSEDLRLQFLKNNNFEFSEVTSEEKIEMKDDLELDTGVDDVLNTTFYKANYIDLIDAIDRRKFHLRRSVAFITGDLLVYIMKKHLKTHFLLILSHTKKVFGNLGDDNSIHFLLSLFKPFSSINFFSINEQVNIENIDKMANTHYPPCMRNMHDILREEHHLKYDCRMQYGVFLYHLGMPYEQAMKLWKDEFTLTKSVYEFTKKYEYLFKHQYGLVGRKKPYRPDTCTSILNNTPRFNQHHGCPFKHWSKDRIRNMLEKDGCHLGEIRDIEDLVKGGHYQKACTAHLCARRAIDVEDIEIIESPNQYTVESLKHADIFEKPKD